MTVVPSSFSPSEQECRSSRGKAFCSVLNLLSFHYSQSALEGSHCPLAGPGPTLQPILLVYMGLPCLPFLLPRPSHYCPQWSVLSFCVLRDGCFCPSIPHPHPRACMCSVLVAPIPDICLCPYLFSHSTAPQRVPVASPSAHNISSSGGAPDRTNFPRGVSSRSTFHAGQLRQVRDQQNLPYGVTPASPSGHSQGRRGASGSIFSKFTSKFVRR